MAIEEPEVCEGDEVEVEEGNDQTNLINSWFRKKITSTTWDLNSDQIHFSLD